MTLDAIKAEIERLPERDRALLASWIQEREDAEWDDQLRADHRAGKLAGLIRRAEKEFDDGSIREAP